MALTAAFRIQAPPFNPIVFIPTSAKSEILNASVRAIFAVAHTIDSPQATTTERTNHWCFYIETADAEFVVLNVTPTGPEGTVVKGGYKANIVLSICADSNVAKKMGGSDGVGITETDIAHFEKLEVTCPADMHFTIQDIVTLIVSEGRHRFEFSAEGTGCRFWVKGMLELFGEMGWVDGEKARMVVGEIGRFWPGGEDLDIDRGEYYQEVASNEITEAVEDDGFQPESHAAS
ncbi:hypothetical protein K505DRAFT_320924 [Melanomma pulvis-pyrius CBS 109.77]|uniref:DUF7770 domain-containing protein n=1 Tax=Melanomma pulvis-pyrius CBS 109.77 TaxID=1314802 RepID=A0A6A6XTI7_9PLEO|nr:hypothetical protein K505DRAFT_320924 [Melanomma pulvis-pyrius CBS 109.77]